MGNELKLQNVGQLYREGHHKLWWEGEKLYMLCEQHHKNGKTLFFCYIYTFLFQGVREAVKNARKWAKQAFRRLEVRVLRPDKEKFQLVRGQEGEGGVRGKWRPHLPPEEDVREEYLSRLSQH